MKNLSIRKKLSLTFGMVLVLYVGALCFAVFGGMDTVEKSFAAFHSGPHQVMNVSMDLRRAIETVEKDLLKMANEEDPEQRAQEQSEMDQAVQDLDSDIAFLKDHLTSGEDVQRAEEIISRQETLKGVRQQILQDIGNGSAEAALSTYKSQYADPAEEIGGLAGGISESARTAGEQDYSRAASTQADVRLAILVYFAVSICVVVALCLSLIHGITRPVREIQAAAKSLADGKLDTAVRYTSADEIGSLADSIRALIGNLRGYITGISQVLGSMSGGDMTVCIDGEYHNDFAPIKHSMEQIVASLNETLWQISVSSQQLAAGSAQMSAGAQALSQGATEQASSSEELAASITEISQRVTQNADSARKASADMDETIGEIRQGDEQMQKLVSAMKQIADTSGEIQKIVKTIDDIAFQTNILSLNAAVEAARAGSAGKGFAVVADEVRNLASKSAAAAKDTTSLIQTTIAAIQNGGQMVVQAEKALTQIGQKAGLVAGLVNEIAEASAEQASSIEQINIGINQISSVIQTNSATAEESAASSEELSAQADVLRNLVSHFKLKSAAPAENLTGEKEASLS